MTSLQWRQPTSAEETRTGPASASKSRKRTWRIEATSRTKNGSYLGRRQIAEARIGALDRRLLDDAVGRAAARLAVAHVARTDAVLALVETVGPAPIGAKPPPSLACNQRPPPRHGSRAFTEFYWLFLVCVEFYCDRVGFYL